MRFASLSHFPFSVLVISLALVATALPTVHSTELLVLTPENFQETISKGVWLIEHFSPYCSHCRHFAPTWEKLVDETEKKEDPGIHLAQVNCIVNGDLCNKNKVNGYPQLNLYRDGEFVETYNQPRDLNLLTAYLEKHAEPSSGGLKLAPTTTHSAPQITSTPTTPRVDYNPNGQVEILTSSTFDAALARGPAFVKFYAPWCGHCKKLAPHWAQLAAHEQHKLTVAEVNCDEQASLCKAQGVQGYPALYYYSKSGQKTEYTGGRKFEQLSAFADKATLPAVQELPEGSLNEKIKESEVLFLFLHPVAEAKLLNTLTIASQMLLGSAPVYTSTSPALFERFGASPSTPILLALKDNDGTVAAQFPLDSATTTDALQSWLARERLPTSLELSADSFKSVMEAPHAPLVVLAAIPPSGQVHDDAVKQLRETAKTWRSAKSGVKRDVVFAWMDGERWSSWLNSMYGLKSSQVPAVVITEHKRLVYWDVAGNGEPIQLTTNSIISSLDAVVKGALPLKHSENIIERMARYLNNKMTWLEEAITGNPYRTGFFLLSFLGLIFFAIKRALADDVNVVFVEHPVNGKGGKVAKSRRAD